MTLNERFNGLTELGLHRLASEYPDHGFIIDREESKKILNNVQVPKDELSILASQLALLRLNPDQPVVLYLNAIESESEEEIEEEADGP